MTVFTVIFKAVIRLSDTKTVSIQVQLMEYAKLHDTIYEVVPEEEECFRFSRLLNFKVSSMCRN